MNERRPEQRAWEYARSAPCENPYTECDIDHHSDPEAQVARFTSFQFDENIASDILGPYWHPIYDEVLEAMFPKYFVTIDPPEENPTWAWSVQQYELDTTMLYRVYPMLPGIAISRSDLPIDFDRTVWRPKAIPSHFHWTRGGDGAPMCERWDVGGVACDGRVDGVGSYYARWASLPGHEDLFPVMTDEELALEEEADQRQRYAARTAHQWMRERRRLMKLTKQQLFMRCIDLTIIAPFVPYNTKDHTKSSLVEQIIGHMKREGFRKWLMEAEHPGSGGVVPLSRERA